MAATISSDFRFEPKVWSDHAKAYRDKKLVYGAFALKNSTLTAEGTGTVVNFPYYNQIGGAEMPEENESLTVDNLTDDSFATSIFEVGKAVGVKKKAFKETADSTAGVISELQEQIGRVHAELVDLRLNNEITSYAGSAANDPKALTRLPIGATANDYDNMLIGYTATAAEHTMNVRTLLTAKILAFGDKSEDAVVCFMHSTQWLDSQIDKEAGFLKADANEPFSAINGFVGRLFNMAIVIVDSCKKMPAQIGGKSAYLAHFHKMNSYGIIDKQNMEMEKDYDVLARESIYTGNQWYGVKSFDRKISESDNKAGGLITTVSMDLVRKDEY